MWWIGFRFFRVRVESWGTVSGSGLSGLLLGATIGYGFDWFGFSGLSGLKNSHFLYVFCKNFAKHLFFTIQKLENIIENAQLMTSESIRCGIFTFCSFKCQICMNFWEI